MEDAHVVFISYASRDREVADAACAQIESAGLRCWIAPRDGSPGVSYAQSLVEAISSSRLVVLVFSQAANDSDAVLNELEIASNRGIPVLPLRIERLEPSGAAEFYLRRRHWLDAYDDRDASLERLAPAVRFVIEQRPDRSAEPSKRKQRNLPRQGTSFVGRSADVARVLGLISEAQFVTIAGPGGVGKTRLALQAALESDDFGDDVHFIDLAPLSNGSLVPATILSAIGAAESGSRTPLDQLVESLGDRHIGLILDNCEHVVAAAAQTVAAILAACPNVTILATSRESLNVASERVYRLNPLDGATSVTLFCERASLANPQFERTAANAATIESICGRLDGLALAIELAAARVRVISVEELSRRLSERFRILTGGSRTALPHQQTLRALIDWSYDVLTPAEAAVFRRIAGFSGTFTLEAVAAVAGFEPIDPWETLDLIATLVDKSLVIAEIDDAGQRYHQLQSIHDYARERLAEQEVAIVVRAHAEFFATFARNAYDEWDLAPRPDWLQRMRVELDNLRAALTWSLDEGNDPALGVRLAGDSTPLFLRLALLGEGVAWCTKALAHLADADPAVAARLHYGLSTLHNNRVALADAAREVERSVVLYRASGDRRGLVRALSQLAQQTARQGKNDDAARIAAEAIADARALGDQRLIASTLQRCGMVHRPADLDRARAEYAESVALFRTLGRDYETANALNWWAIAEIVAGEFERGIDLSLEALGLATGDLRLYALNNIAASALAIADFERGGPAAREALRLACESNNAAIVANAISYLAALAASSDLVAAAQLFGYSQARLVMLGWKPDNTDDLRIERLQATLQAGFAASELSTLVAQGAALDDERALALAHAI